MKKLKNIPPGTPHDVLNENFERMTPKTVKCLNIDRHPGTTFYQTSFIDPAVERLNMTCSDLMQENGILKSELEKLKEKPLLKGNENYQLVKENNPSEILIIKALAGHHQSWLYKEVFKSYGAFIRRIYGKKISN